MRVLILGIYGMVSSCKQASLRFLILSIVAAILPSTVKADTALYTFSHDGIASSCSATDAGVECKVEIANGQLTDAFTLENPARLVADFKATLGQSIKVPSTKVMVAAKNDHLVKQFRLGSGAATAPGGSIRAVIDLERLPQISISKGSNSVVFKYSAPQIKQSIVVAEPSATPLQKLETTQPKVIATSPGTPSQLKAPVLSPTATFTVAPTATFTVVPTLAKPTATPTATKTSTPTATRKASPIPTEAPPTSTPTHVPTLTPTSVVKQATEQIPTPMMASSSSDSIANTSGEGNSQIEKILFEKSSGSTVRVVLTGKAEARASKLDERTYEVIVPGFQLAGKYLALPYFPPEDFGGVTHVKLTQKPEAVQIIVGVNRGVRIVPTTKEGELILKIVE